MAEDNAAAAAAKWVEDHKNRYLESDGQDGHLLDYTTSGTGHPYTPTLLLKTIGRKSGREIITPLIYGRWKGDFVIVGSKGGAPEHPAWYLNIQANPHVTIQAACEKFTAQAHDAPESERPRIWDYMQVLFPGYTEYQKGTDRTIPVVLLTPTAKVEKL